MKTYWTSRYQWRICGLSDVTITIWNHDAMSKHADISCAYLNGRRGRTAADVIHGDDIEQVNGVSFKASNGVMIGADVGDFFVFLI